MARVWLSFGNRRPKKQGVGLRYVNLLWLRDGSWPAAWPSPLQELEQEEEEEKDRAVGFHLQEVGIVANRAKNPVGER